MIQAALSGAVCATLSVPLGWSAGTFPRTVRIETTNACNARCLMCPRRAMTRPVRFMSAELFEAIIDQCVQHGCNDVHLHNFGEPLLDRLLEQRVRYAKQRGIGRVKIFTNGSLLDARRAEGLLEAGLDELNISIDGDTPEQFEQIRQPLKFDKVIGNIRGVLELRKRSGACTRVRLTCCTSNGKPPAMDGLAGQVDAISLGRLHNWATEDYAAPRRRIRKPCARIWRSITILAGGEVVPCCLDFDGRYVLGRLTAETTIAEIWNGPAYTRLRSLHRLAQQQRLLLCRDCSKCFL